MDSIHQFEIIELFAIAKIGNREIGGIARRGLMKIKGPCCIPMRPKDQRSERTHQEPWP
jgi:hypothetical protein